MAVIHKIREKLLNREYEFSVPHFFEEMANDNIDLSDILLAVSKGKINRKFTKDIRGTRYEIVGKIKDGRTIAVICRIKDSGKILFITTYEKR